jgi:hypothetical protein
VNPAKALKKRGLVHVPTVAELVEDGLAEVVAQTPKGAPTHYRPTKKGQKKINAAMAHNAPILRVIDAEYRQARVAEQLAREKADNLMALLNHASKGI